MPKTQNHTLETSCLKLGTILLPAVYGICVFLFFWKIFPHHLHYREQFQLFLYTKDYFIDTCSHPGGFCNYASRFVTQFYLFSFAGALLISCLLTGIQLLVYAVTRRFGKHSAGLLLSFIPSLFYWYLFCDENTHTGGIIALLFTLIATLAGTFPKSQSKRRIFLFASIPVLYQLAGGVVILSVIVLLWYDINKARKSPDLSREDTSMKKRLSFFIVSIAAICFAIALPFIAKYFLAQYPLYRYLFGVDYVHFVLNEPIMICFLWLSILLSIAGALYLPVIKKMRTSVTFILQLCALLFGVYFMIAKNGYMQNRSKEELMAYDYHCKMKNWDKIIEMANRKTPTIPMTVTCLNLALYKTGQLPDKMFDYFQNGPEGLLPTFQRDFMIPLVGCEPYWHLGYVNAVQYFTFEAMEALPDGQKSVRSIKRLAETNLINGHYEVASKYLHLLEHTLFYRNWAKETRKFLYNEAKIDAHPEWGEIRRFKTDKDFIFSGDERDMMLGILFQQHPDNRMAYEYLMAYTLLMKDINNFPEYFQLNKDFTYNEIPKSYQEAIVYIWGLSGADMESVPFPISRSVMQGVAAYAQIYTTMQSPESELRRYFSKTYWFYLHFQKFSRPQIENILQY